MKQKATDQELIIGVALGFCIGLVALLFIGMAFLEALVFCCASALSVLILTPSEGQPQE